MAAWFVCNAEFGTCSPPFRTMRRDAASTRACLCEEMREFMAKRSVDLGGSMFSEPWIQAN